MVFELKEESTLPRIKTYLFTALATGCILALPSTYIVVSPLNNKEGRATLIGLRRKPQKAYMSFRVLTLEPVLSPAEIHCHHPF
jgi:hypothetical protein